VASTRFFKPLALIQMSEGRGPRSAACPFDSDLQIVVLEILSRGKWQTSSMKAGKSCSNARALK
jgi:hypothetical protein